MNSMAKTPVASHFFNVNDRAKKLTHDKAELFHHMVAKLLYLFRITHQDIQTAMETLFTRVKCPDEDDITLHSTDIFWHRRRCPDSATYNIP